MSEKKLSNQEWEKVVERLQSELNERRRQIERIEEIIRKEATQYSGLKIAAAVKSIIQERDSVSKKFWEAKEQIKDFGKVASQSLEDDKKLIKIKEKVDGFFRKHRNQ